MFYKALKWPMISLAIAAVAHQITVIILPALKPIFSPLTVGPLIWVSFGSMVGYKIVQFGGKYIHVILVGIVLGPVPLTVKTIFGSIGGAGAAEIVNESVFAMGILFFGALIGGSFALSR